MSILTPPHPPPTPTRECRYSHTHALAHLQPPPSLKHWSGSRCGDRAPSKPKPCPPSSSGSSALAIGSSLGPLRLVGTAPRCQGDDRNNRHQTLSPHLLKAQRLEKLGPACRQTLMRT